MSEEIKKIGPAPTDKRGAVYRAWRNAVLNEWNRADKAKMTHEEIAAAIGVSEPTISRLQKATGIKKIFPRRGFPSVLEPHKEWIKENYQLLGPKLIAERFGVNRGTVIKFRKMHNIDAVTNVGQWKRHPHPRGMLGKMHSADERKRISERSVRMWADPLSELNSEEQKQKRSDSGVAYQFKNRFSQRFSRANCGKREDLGGLYVRSTWEANYARYLNFLRIKGQIYKWEYESDTFWFEGIKRGCRFYTPDFKVWDTPTSDPVYHEVKGWMDQKSRTKLDRMKRYHPNVTVVLIDAKQYRAISKFAALILGWETSKHDAKISTTGQES